MEYRITTDLAQGSWGWRVTKDGSLVAFGRGVSSEAEAIVLAQAAIRFNEDWVVVGVKGAIDGAEKT